MTEHSSPASRRAEIELDALLSAAVDAIIIIDANGRIETFNPGAERLFGYRAAEIVGRDVATLMPTGDRERHTSYMDAYERTGHRRVIGSGRDVMAQRADGSLFPVFLSVGEIRGAERSRFVGILHDMSARRAAVDALSKSESLLRAAQELANLGNFEVGTGDGRVTWSAMAARIVGFDPDDAPATVEDYVACYVHPDDRERYRIAWRAALDSADRFELAYRVVRPGGATRDLHSIIQPLDRSVHEPTVLGTLHDMTERRAAEDELRKSHDRLTHFGRLSTMGEMATGLSHEINQPLTAIATYAQASVRMLDSGTANTTDLREALTAITQQSLRAGDVIRRMRSLVKNRETHAEPIDLNRLVQEVRVLADTDARVNDLRLAVDLAPAPLPPVVADPIQIQQVLLNLVRNAIDATIDCPTAPREVRISTRVVDGSVEVAVTDQGSGISTDAAPRLFEAFYTTKSTGTGLGLAISKSIIRAHQGRLAFRANAGTGATFYFTLPCSTGA